MLALLLAAAAPQTAVNAERAFAADAQTLGQWTAFRKWAAPDAVMFTPQPTSAQTFLKPLHDPSHPIRWSPTDSFVACDGQWAANTGEWRQPDGSVGYFSTIWHRRSDGVWRWLVDGGDRLQSARRPAGTPAMRVARCGGTGRGTAFGSEGNSGYGASGDATLRWRWHVEPNGARLFRVELWNGRGYDTVIDDHIAAPAPRSAAP